MHRNRQMKYKILNLSKKALRFHSLPTLNDYKCYRQKNSLKLLEKYCSNELIFSAKSCNTKEPMFLTTQFRTNTKLINIKNDTDIRIIDTKDGGVFFNNDQLLFILIPRKEV